MLGVMIGLMILVQGYGSDKINEDRHSSARTLVVSGQDRQAGEAAFQNIVRREAFADFRQIPPKPEQPARNCLLTQNAK
jgi:hypothetical protein